MPRYTIDTYTSKVRRTEAYAVLVNMTDDDILARITQGMLPAQAPFNDERIWDEDEPEHAGLASAIRTQAIRDLDVLFARSDDTWCDNVLGIGYDILTGGLPCLCVVYDNDDMEDVESYRNANPVNRLRALRICEKPVVETIPEVNGARYTRGAIQYVTVPTTITATNTASNWQTMTDLPVADPDYLREILDRVYTRDERF